MTERKTFDELIEGIAAMKSQRQGKFTLRTFSVEAAPLPKVDSKLTPKIVLDRTAESGKLSGRKYCEY